MAMAEVDPLDWRSNAEADYQEDDDVPTSVFETDYNEQYSNSAERQLKKRRRICIATSAIAVLLVLVVSFVGGFKPIISSFSSSSSSTDSEPQSPGNENSNNKEPPPQQCSLPDSFENNFKGLRRKHRMDLCIENIAEPVKCRCDMPVEPVTVISFDEQEVSKWNATHQMNLDLLQNASKLDELDVVLLGDSITEHWNGRDMGEFKDEWQSQSMTFDQMFDKANGGSVEGLALGIAGDRTQHLLYRLMNGEMPSELQPKFWWILIGTENSQDYCTAEAITAGNIRIVQEIQRHHPDATIVLQALLPRGGSELLHQNALWKLFQVVNHQLECYANNAPNNNNNPRVHFVNFTDRFIFQNDKDGAKINQTLLGDYMHPTAEGAKIYGQAIVDTVQSLV